MARQIVYPGATGYFVDGIQMPLPSIGAIWRNPHTGKHYKAIIEEDGAIWLEFIFNAEPPTNNGAKSMSAIERFTNLDQILADARREAQSELDAASAKIFQLETENVFLKGAVTDARNAERSAQRMAVKLLTQFALVETIFHDVKAQAIALAQDETASNQTGEQTAQEEILPGDELAGSTDDPPHGEANGAPEAMIAYSQPEPPPVPSRASRKLKEG